jgi:hypothetical protein
VLTVEGFFKPPPPPPREPEQRPPPWMGPPENVWGATVAWEAVLANTGEAAVCVGNMRAYPTGFELTVVSALRRPNEFAESFDPGWRFRARRGPELPDELLRFGVEFADGSRATNLGSWPSHDAPSEPSGPVLIERGGGGRPGYWHQDYWIWPLPPDGPLQMVCEWPRHGIPVTMQQLDAAVIRTAAQRAHMLWPDERPEGEGPPGPPPVAFSS